MSMLCGAVLLCVLELREEERRHRQHDKKVHLRNISIFRISLYNSLVKKIFTFVRNFTVARARLCHVNVT